MKRTKVLTTLIAGLVAVIGVTMVACNPKEELPPEPGTETGVYYYDAVSGDEYKLSMYDGDQATLVMGNILTGGTYTRTENDLAFSFKHSSVGEVSAKYDESADVVTLTYNNSDMRFLRATEYTVTYNSNSGSEVDGAKVINGKTLAKPEDPTRDGYTFIGWYTDSNFGTPFMFGSQPVTGDMTLYAQWGQNVFGENVYTVKFDAGYEGAPAMESKQTVGGKLYDVEAPTRSGYEFKGWWYSMTGKADELTYRVDSDTVFNESTTLYALWQSSAQGGKLPEPLVSVNSQLIRWDAVSGAGSYVIEITGPEGFTFAPATRSETSMQAPFTLTGDYTVSVKAKDKGSADNDSEPAIRKYRHNALTRVSLFSVVEPSILLFNPVANAEKYIIKIDCGDKGHNHSAFDNGTSTNFNFANCQMQDGGIKFTVTATAGGYAPSVSETFVYNKLLDKIGELKFDEATETVSWGSVPYATNYVVSVKCGNHEHVIEDIGSRTSYSLKECAQFVGNEEAGTKDGIVFNVYPKTKGYNSPAATSYTYNKTRPATPGNIKIKGNILSWNAVEGEGVTYRFRINNRIIDTDETEYDLSTLPEFVWTDGSDYYVSVAAVQGNKDSIWSDAVDARYNALYSTLSYNRNTVTWRFVIGVDGYQVRINEDDSTTVNVTDGSNFAKIALTKSGDNIIQVRFVDGEDYSDWAELTVRAYSVAFDTRGGEVAQDGNIRTRYYAIGDEVSLPTNSDVVREGYDLDGWYNTPGGSAGNGARYTDEYYSEMGDIILYANWKAATYTVTLDFNDGGNSKSITANVTYGETYSLPVPTAIFDKVNVFGGWCINPTGSGTVLTDVYGESSRVWSYAFDRTLYAVWIPVFKFEKHAGGEGGFYYTVTSNEGSDAVVELTIPANYQGKNDDVAYPVDQISASLLDKNNYPNLEIVNIPSTITMAIDNSVFSSYYTPEGLKEINVYEVPGISVAMYFSEDGVLYWNNSTASKVEVWGVPRGKTGSLTISDKATSIPKRAFYSSNVSELNIPSSITEIYDDAFSSAKFKKINFLSTKNQNESTDAVKIFKDAFAGLSNVTEITFPSHKFLFTDKEGVELDKVDLHEDVFQGMSKLERIYVDDLNPDYKSVDGMLCRNDNNVTLLYVPKTRTGNSGENNQIFTIPTGIYAIGSYAFSGCSKIKEVEIPTFVTIIEDHAFTGYNYINTIGSQNVLLACPITKVTFSGIRVVPLTIGDYAFGSAEQQYACTKLAEIAFKSDCNVTKIGDYAFANTSIKELNLPRSLATVGKYAFYNCLQINAVQYENNGEKSVNLSFEENAFANCNALKTFYFAENVVDISPYGLFNGCENLTYVSVSENNKYFSVDQNVLFRNSLKTIKDADGNDILDAAGNVQYVVDSQGNKIPEVNADGSYIWDTILYYPAGKKDGFIVPETVTRLGNGLFRNNKDIPSVEIHENVVFIGDDVFSGCTGITSIIIKGGNKALTVGKRLFNGCTGLETIELPSRIKSITENMFSGCNKLISVTIGNDIIEISDGAFSGCTALKNINIKGMDAVDGVVKIPATVKKVGDSAFSNCSALDTVIFIAPVSVVDESNANDFVELTIGSGAFQSSGVVDINLPARLISVGASAFASCNGLETINIPYTVKEIGGSAFASCTNLVNIEFDIPPAGVVRSDLRFGPSAFSGCTGLVKIVLPEGLTGIPEYCFSGCSNLCYVYIPNTVANDAWVAGSVQGVAIKAYAFNDCVKLGAEYTNDNGNVCDGGLEFQSGGIGNGLSFTANTFKNCPSLKALNLPARLQSALDSVGNEMHVFGDYIYDGVVNKTNYNRNSTLKAAFNDGSQLVAINIDENCENYFSYDGLPYWVQTEKPYWKQGYDAAVEVPVKSVTLAFCPAGRTGTIDISKDATIIFPNFLLLSKGVTGVTFQAGGTEDLIIGINNVPLSASGNWSIVFNGAMIENMVLPARLKEIANQAFMNYTPLKSLSFEDDCRLVRIGERAFQSARQLVKIDNMPASLEIIDQYAFSGSASYRMELNEITFAEGKFERKNANGETVVDVAGNIIYDKTALKEIGNYAFQYTSFANFYVPASVHTLGATLFKGSTLLKDVTLSANIENFDGTFNDCIAAIKVSDEANSNFSSPYNDDVIYSSDLSTLAMYPSSIKEEEYVIPHGVKKIAHGAFANNSYIKRVVIPNSVNYIGNQAFSRCSSLEEVYFVPDEGYDDNGLPYNDYQTAMDLVVGETNTGSADGDVFSSSTTESSTYDKYTDKNAGVFAYCESLKKINFPKRTVKLGARSFYKCYDLEEVTFADGCDMELLEYNMFANRTKLKTVKLPDGLKRMGSSYDNYAKVPQSMQTNASTGGNVFYGCSALTEIVLPEGLEIIDDNCFAKSGITNIVIPASVKRLGTKVFSSCENLETVEFAKGSELEYFYYKSGVTSGYGFSNSGANNTFEKCTSLTSVTLPYGLKATGNSLFEGCSALTTIKTWSGRGNGVDVVAVDGLPTYNLEYIGTSVFKGTKLSGEIVIGGKIASLPKAAFAGTDITSVIFSPSTRGSLTLTAGTGTDAANGGPFAGCTKLRYIEFNRNVAINKYAFYGAGTDVEIINGKGFSIAFSEDCKIKSIGESSFENSGLTELVIPAHITTIGANAFKNNKLLKSVVFSDRSGALVLTGGTSASTGVFNGCSSLESVTFPESNLAKVGAYSFYNCSKLSDVKFGGVKELDNYAFAGTNFKNIMISENITKIGNSTFRNNSQLISVSFANDSALASIGSDAFTGCGQLKAFQIPASVTTLGDLSAFASCSALTSLTVANGNSNFISLNDAVYSADKTILYAYATGKTGEFVLQPETVEIKQGAFFGAKLSKFIAKKDGETQLNIPQYTFQNCSELEEINISCKTIVGQYAFAYCNNLTTADKMVFGAGSDFAKWAFANCQNIVSFHVPDDTQASVLAFDGCAKLSKDNLTFGENTVYGTTLTINDVTIAANKYKNDVEIASVIITKATTIGNLAFSGCTNLKTVTLPSTLTSIGYGAFQDTALTSVTIPASVTFMDNGVFAGSKVKTVTFEATTNELAMKNGSSKTSKSSAGTFGMMPELTTVDFNGRPLATRSNATATGTSYVKNRLANYTFAASDNLVNVNNLSSVINEIGNYVFTDCNALASLSLPNTVTSIGTYAFQGSGLTSFVIPNQVTIINNYTFNNCESLTSITMHDNITAINNNAFSDSGLTSIDLPAKLKTIGDNAFKDLPVTFDSIPAKIETIGVDFFKHYTKDDITLPKTVTTLSKGSFAGTSIKHIVFEKGDVDTPALTLTAGTALDNDASTGVFGRAANLISVDFNNRVLASDTLNNYTFAQSEALTTISNLNAKVSTIGKYAFYGCKKLNNIDLSNVSKKINERAFYNCVELQTVNLAKTTVTTIYFGEYAFAKSGITSITLPEGMTNLEDYVFSGCSNLSEVSFPTSLVRIYDYAFEDCTALEEIILPENTTDIRKGIFKGCTSLAKVVLAEKTKTLPQYGFEGCVALNSIVINSYVTTADADAFKGWTNSQTIYVVGYQSNPPGWSNGWSGGATVVWDYKIPTETP